MKKRIKIHAFGARAGLQLAPGLALWLSAGCLYAESATVIQGSLRPGESQLLASYYEIRNSDCLALRAPMLQISREPALGSVTVVQSQGLADHPSKCAHVAVPVTQVHYQAFEPGADHIAWEVQFQSLDRGTEQVQAQLLNVPK